MSKRNTARKGRSAAGSAMNPLPSLIRASAFDAANVPCVMAGRKKWSRADYNVMCDTQDRLIRACYGKADDAADSKLCYIRFQIAEQLERQGSFDLRSDLKAVMAFIDNHLSQPMAA